jgi:dTDP-glucose 4,6-dehydratase
MNYLVTGGAGFIGSNYVRMLLSGQLGPVSKVKVLDKLTYAGSTENLSEISNDPRFTFIQGDIREESTANSCIDKDDVIVHFAAESHVDRSIIGPSEFIMTNVVGTQVLLSAAVQKKARIFLHVSTDEVYGSISEGNSVETDPLMPNSPYSASKAASDLIARSYFETFGLDVRTTRCCNNYGPNQYPEKFIPLAIKKLISGEQIPIYGDGKNVREWIHVEEHCKGIQSVLNFGSPGHIYNIGSQVQLSNLEIAKILTDSFGTNFESSIKFVEDRPGHDFRYSLNSNKIQQIWKKRTFRNIRQELFLICEQNRQKWTAAIPKVNC